MRISDAVLLRLALCCAFGLGATGCKNLPFQIPGTTKAKTGVGGAGAGNGGLTGTLTVPAALGPANKLNVWLFGPVVNGVTPDIGIVTTLGTSGDYAYPPIAPGKYLMMVGHAWATPQTRKGAGGTMLRELDWGMKLSPHAEAKDAPVAGDDVLLVNIDTSTTTLPPVALTAEAFSLDWDIAKFRPQPQETLQPLVSQEIWVQQHPAGVDLEVKVHMGLDGGGGEVFSGKAIAGRFVWRGVVPGPYAYQATSHLVSSQAISTAWIPFTVPAH